MTHLKNDIYMTNLMTRQVGLPFHLIGENIKENLHQKLQVLEGKCINEGYIKSNSINIITYSSGIIKGLNVIFNVVFEALVCRPVEGMQMICIVKNITKAGIKAEVNETPTPVVIFIARDHNYMSKQFSSIQENQIIKVRVIGQRYELNDKYISIIAELVTKYNRKKEKKLKVCIVKKNK